MLNVQRLKLLREVAARGSFSAAADALSYTQSAVSQAVAKLEAEAGVPLIERDRRRRPPHRRPAPRWSSTRTGSSRSSRRPRPRSRRSPAAAAAGCGWRRSRPRARP